MHQDKVLREKKPLRATRRGTIHSGEAPVRISPRGRLASDCGPSSRRSGPRRPGARDRRHPAPPRRRHRRRRDAVPTVPGARSGWQKPAGNRRLGASDRPGRVDRAVAERAAAPIGGLPVRGDATFAGGQGRPARPVGGAVPAPDRPQRGQPSGQQRDGLADPCALRSRPRRLPPSGDHRRARRGIAAALRAGRRRGGDRRSRLCQSAGTARVSRWVRPARPRRHRAGWLECAGAAGYPRRAVQPDRDARQVCRQRQGRTSGQYRCWAAPRRKPRRWRCG